MRLAGWGGEVGSKVWEMVVVAVVRLPARPVRRVCEKRVCGGLLGAGPVGDEIWEGWGGGADVVGVEVGMGALEGSEVEWVFSREAGGASAVIVVATDWLREMRQSEAAEWRRGTMAGPGSRWAFVRWAQVQMARGPRVYWDWTVSVIGGSLSH